MREAQWLEIVLSKALLDFPKTSQKFSVLPYCKAAFLKILFKNTIIF